MSADDMAEFYVHTATVEPFAGTNGYGEDTFDAPVILTPPNGCFIDGSRKLVRDKDGAQVVSESTLFTYPVNAALFKPGSRVTVNGEVSTVIKSNLHDSGDLDLPDHIEVSLT